MNTQRWLALAAAGTLALGAAACGGSGGGGGGASQQVGGSINGAGATFPEPVYNELSARLQEQKGLTVNYNGIGSGGGIAQFTAGTVDFGATDSAMDDEELAAAEKKGQPLHVPSVFGAVTVAYNLPGTPKGLKLDGQTVADMFLGKIKTWDDPAIAKLNPGVKLPSTAVTIVHRNDESGTTKLFTTFLSDYSKAWESGPGADKSVRWPTGTGAKGNDGVAAAVKQTEGAVGYVEQAFALANNFTTASVKNKSGAFVEPSLEGASAAGEGLDLPSDLRFSAIDAPGAKAYPIASGTFLLAYKDACKSGLTPDKAQRLKTWLDYVLSDGQKAAPELQYAPLPAPVLEKAKAAVATMRCNGKPLKAAGAA